MTMPTFNPKKAISGGINGITQFVGYLSETKHGVVSDRAEITGTSSVLLFTDVDIEAAGKAVELKDNRLSHFIKESEEPQSKWMKVMRLWIDFAVKQEWFKEDDEEAIESLFDFFKAQRIRFSKVVITQASGGFAPGLAFVPTALLGAEDAVEELVLGRSAINPDQKANSVKTAAIKTEVSDEVIEAFAANLDGETDGLEKAQFKVVVMQHGDAASRTPIIQAGGFDKVLDAAVAAGAIFFNGDAYLLAKYAAESFSDDGDSDESASAGETKDVV